MKVQSVLVMGMIIAIMAAMLGGCCRPPMHLASDLSIFDPPPGTPARQVVLTRPARVAVAHIQPGLAVGQYGQFHADAQTPNRLVAIEAEEDRKLFRALRDHPQITDVWALHPQKDLPGAANAEVQPGALVRMARNRGADMLLVYTTGGYGSSDVTLGPVGFVLTLVTLGAFPGVGADADATTDARLIDLSTASVIAQASESSHQWQPANLYTMMDAQRQTFDRAMTHAARKSARQVAEHWADMADRGSVLVPGVPAVVTSVGSTNPAGGDRGGALPPDAAPYPTK